MDTEQTQWATQIRELPNTFREVLHTADDQVIRHRPAAREWSAIEVLGTLNNSVPPRSLLLPNASELKGAFTVFGCSHTSPGQQCHNEYLTMRLWAQRPRAAADHLE